MLTQTLFWVWLWVHHFHLKLRWRRDCLPQGGWISFIQLKHSLVRHSLVFPGVRETSLCLWSEPSAFSCLQPWTYLPGVWNASSETRVVHMNSVISSLLTHPTGLETCQIPWTTSSQSTSSFVDRLIQKHIHKSTIRFCWRYWNCYHVRQLAHTWRSQRFRNVTYLIDANTCTIFNLACWSFQTKGDVWHSSFPKVLWNFR